MKTNLSLPIASLLSIVLLTFHLADDVVLGKDVLDITRLCIYLPIIAVWLYATLVLTERPSELIIALLGSLLGLAVVAIHASGPAGIHGEFFHVWLLVAIGGTSLFALLLAVSRLVAQKNATHWRTRTKATQ